MPEAFKVDLLKLYFGDPYPVTDRIIINQPSIQEVMEYGENEFFSMLYIFIGNTTFRKLELWESGVDWNKVSDYELFCRLVGLLPVERTRIFFGDVDFQKFKLIETAKASELPAEPQVPEGKKLTVIEKRKLYFKQFEECVTFYDEEDDIEINAETYHKIVDILREMVHIYPKTEYTVGKISKELLIEEEKQKLIKASKEADKPSSILQPLISACVNHPGFKYRKSELRMVQLNEFMDSVRRLQVYEATHALLGGSYSGFMDTSKVPKDNFDFMRTLDN